MVHDTLFFPPSLLRIGKDYTKLASHMKKGVVNASGYRSVADS